MTQLARGALQTWRVSSLTGGGISFVSFPHSAFRPMIDFCWGALVILSNEHLLIFLSTWLVFSIYLFSPLPLVALCIYDAVSLPLPHHFFPTTAFRFPPLLMRPFSASCRPVLWWERVPSRSATRLKAGGLQWGRWERGWVWGRQAGRAGLQWGRGWWWWGGRRSRWARSAAGGN